MARMVGAGWIVGLPSLHLDDDAELARSVRSDEIGRINASFGAYRLMYAGQVMEWLKFVLLLSTIAFRGGRVRKTRKPGSINVYLPNHSFTSTIPVRLFPSGFLSLHVCYLLQKSPW